MAGEHVGMKINSLRTVRIAKLFSLSRRNGWKRAPLACAQGWWRGKRRWLRTYLPTTVSNPPLPRFS